MKSAFALLTFIFSTMVFAGELPIYPDCYRGKMQTADGKNADVFVSFSSVEKNIVRVQTLQVGSYTHQYTGTLLADNKVTFNSNDDYIPGGNASFNIDIAFDFGAAKPSGSYKEYHFEDGYGGFGQSDARSLISSGEFQLKKCRVQVTDN